MTCSQCAYLSGLRKALRSLPNLRSYSSLYLQREFAVTRDKHRFDPNRRPQKPQAILDIFSSLGKVSYTDECDTVFIRESGTTHLSVKEYLISEQIRSSSLSHYHLNQKLAISAISRDFCNLVLWTAYATKVRPQYHLAEFWITYARSNNGVIQSDIQELVTKLLSPSGVNFNNWITLFDVDRDLRQLFLEDII